MIPDVQANGAAIPALGFGTWRLRGAEATEAVQVALATGYRHIDTAAAYGNETEVGEAIRNSGIARADLFVTTKVWPDDVDDGPFQRSAEASLKRLGLGQVDLLLIHWPNPDVPLRRQLAGLCKAKRQGLARHIGVSNFPPLYIEEAVRIADEPIVTNQVEHHPYIDQSALFAVCGRNGIAITSYAPLGRTTLFDDPVIGRIANAKGRSAAQVILRWHIQIPGNVAIPKSSSHARIAENLAISGFSLTPEEMQAISGLARRDGRMVSAPVALDWSGAPPR